MTPFPPADPPGFRTMLDRAAARADELARELLALHAQLDTAAAADYRVRATRYRLLDAERSCRHAADELLLHALDRPSPDPRPSSAHSTSPAGRAW